MKIQKIYIGGWFQRTTLHLTEVFDFFNEGRSELGFPQKELDEARAALELASVSRESGLLEYIAAESASGISFRIYEDGLMVLEKDFSDLKADCENIKDYYDNKLSHSLSFIFSKGAPVPKELANIKTLLPYIVTVRGANKKEIKKLFSDFSESVYSVITSKSVEVYRSSGMIVIKNLRDEKMTREIIESQIFFREFKSQLHRYLAIHRAIWEKIARIKERGEVQGTDIDALRNELSGYQKTINLIGARIDQMGTYLKTRQKITDLKAVDEYLKPLFQFKFETLQDTHEYIKHLWRMTENYLKNAVELFVELQGKSTKNTISSLQVITTIGVVAGILGYLSKDALPTFTVVGLFYFVLLLAMTWLINNAVSQFFRHKRYRIQDSQSAQDIGLGK